MSRSRRGLRSLCFLLFDSQMFAAPSDKDNCFAKSRQNGDKVVMANTKLSGNPTGIPEGYIAIPIQESEAGATVRLCVLVRQTPDPAAGHLVLLRDLPDAMVYLGCLTDAGGRLREWAEL